MGEALLIGLLKKNLFNKKNIAVSEKQEERIKFLKQKYSQITFIKDNQSLVKNSSVIILAIKPQDMESLLKEISPLLTASHLIISIAAGIKISFIEKIIQKKFPIIRAMPNLPALIGEGITAYCVSQSASGKDEKIAEAIIEVRKGNFCFSPPGFDGSYGELTIGQTSQYHGIKNHK